MSIPATEIRERALKELGVTATAQTTQAEISTDLDQAYVEIYGMLEALTLTTWDFDEEVPDEMILPVVYMVAAARVNAYSIPNDRYNRIRADAQASIGLIREMQASNVYRPPEATYY